MGATLSPDYPKWLYYRGKAPVQVKDQVAAEPYIEKGYVSQPTIDDYEESAPVAGQPVSVPDKPGTVPTSVMDDALMHQKEKFDSAWDLKCKELAGAKNDNAKLTSEHAKLISDHKALVDEHVTALKKIAALQEAVTAATNANAKVDKPVVAPVKKAE